MLYPAEPDFHVVALQDYNRMVRYKASYVQRSPMPNPACVRKYGSYGTAPRLRR